ncbi:MAG TPA: HEAT repeat domain-containing protein [Thioploca sp.]|nr:HEAT repeat domain-containing protein [Thioploca sp.]
MNKQVIEALCNLITTGDEVDRCYSAQALGKLKDKQAVPILIQCLRDEDVDVVIDSIIALGNIGDPTAIPSLLESLNNDPDGEVKTSVVKALANINSSETIAPLLKIAQTNPDDIIWDESNDWNAWWDMQLIAVKALGTKKVTAAVPILVNILADEEAQDIESELLTALAQIGGNGEEILIKRLTTGTIKTRRRAAIALSLSHSKSARKALALALSDKNVEVRIAAIKSLGKQDAKMYFDIILRFLQDPEPEMRQTVIEILTSLATPEQLSNLLFDPSPKVRIAVLKALYNVDIIPKQVLTQIKLCLNEPNSNIVATAALLLANSKEQSILITLLQILSDIRRDATLRSKVATALGMLGNLEAINILTWAIEDKEQIVRLAALNALMQLASLDLENPTKMLNPLEIIINTLKTIDQIDNSESEAQTPENVEDLLENIPDTPPQSTLEAITNNKKIIVDEDSAILLQTSELKDVQEYINIAQKNIQLGERLFTKKQLNITTDIRHLSANILGNSDKSEAVIALITVLNDADLELRLIAITALGHIAKRSPEIEELADSVVNLKENLTIEDSNIRLACVRTLGYLGNQNEVLFNYLQDEVASVRVQTIQSLMLTNIADKDISKFVELLQDNDINVRKSAAEALAKLKYIDALDAIINSAFTTDGAIARDIGKSLHSLDIERSNAKLLQKLIEVPNSSYRRFIIEMLEEVNI